MQNEIIEQLRLWLETIQMQIAYLVRLTETVRVHFNILWEAKWF